MIPVGSRYSVAIIVTKVPCAREAEKKLGAAFDRGHRNRLARAQGTMVTNRASQVAGGVVKKFDLPRAADRRRPHAQIFFCRKNFASGPLVFEFSNSALAN